MLIKRVLPKSEYCSVSSPKAVAREHHDGDLVGECQTQNGEVLSCVLEQDI